MNVEGAKDALYHFANPKNQETMALGSGGFAPPSLEVSDTIYSPLQLELLEDISNNTVWAFNYDLATEPKKNQN